jgi:hypothetical protein
VADERRLKAQRRKPPSHFERRAFVTAERNHALQRGDFGSNLLKAIL